MNCSSSISGNKIFAGSYFHGIYVSTNNGINWYVTSQYDGTTYSLASIYNIIYAGTDGSGVYYSTNSGNNWAPTNLTGKYVHSLVAKDTNLYAATDNWGIYHSSDYGYSWKKIIDSVTVTSLAVDDKYIIAGIKDKGILYYPIFDSNWVIRNQGFDKTPPINSLFISGNYVLAGTNRSVWKRDYYDLIDTTIKKKIYPTVFRLYQNYPNPFNSITTIKYDVEKATTIKIVVYNILGCKIETLVNEVQPKDKYEVKWNASQYSSGIYFLKIIHGDYSDTKKMLMIK